MAAQGTETDSDYALTNKRRVVQFVQGWSKTILDAFWEDKTIIGFLEVSYIGYNEEDRHWSRRGGV